MKTISFLAISLIATETEKKGDKEDEKPTVLKESQATEAEDNIASINRAYSPIIEDPRERDSRSASVDPSERSELSSQTKQDDNVSSSSRTHTPSSEPSRMVTPTLGQALSSALPALETSAKGRGSKVADIGSHLEGKSNDSSVELEPIFKPLKADKGTSKTTGKSVGGWI